MSRLKNFPDKISVGMNADGELILLPEKADWGIFVKEQLKKVETYNLVTDKALRKPQRGRPLKSAPINATSPKTDESTKKPMFHCKACGRDVENPKTAADGKAQCPHCFAVDKIVGKE